MSNHFIIRPGTQAAIIKNNAVTAVKSLPLDELTEITIRPYRKSKSQEQLSYLWGIVLPTISKHVEESTGEHYSTDDMYEYFIGKYAETKVAKTPLGVPFTYKVSASKMNTKQMSDFIGSIIQHAASSLNCVIPDPEQV